MVSGVDWEVVILSDIDVGVLMELSRSVIKAFQQAPAQELPAVRKLYSTLNGRLATLQAEQDEHFDQARRLKKPLSDLGLAKYQIEALLMEANRENG